MKILSLQAENVKRLKAVSITFKDGLMVIGGKNGAGKSSCLDAIAMALGGKSFVCDQPLRKGETRGHITIELGEPAPKFKVTRKFGLKGTTSLTIEAADGSRPASPQTLLDGLLGSLSFDPLAFSRMDVKRQADTLRQLVGLDTTKIDREIESAFTARADVGREMSRLEGAVAQAAWYPDAPAAEESVTAIASELNAAKDLVSTRERQLDRAADLERSTVARNDRLKEIERQLAALSEEKEIQQARIREALKEAGKLKAEAIAIQIPDLEAIRARLNTAETTNRKVRANAERTRLAGELAGRKRTHDEATRKLESLRDGRRKMIESSKFPIDGLAIDEGGVLYEGLPFSQASQAEQLRVSVAIGFAMNPKLKLLLIRDGSLLDETNLDLVAQMAEAAGAQILMERVGSDKHTAVVIEDGMVAAEGVSHD